MTVLEDKGATERQQVHHYLSGAVRDTPPIAQYPFEIVSQRGVSHPFALFLIGYRASIAEIPLLRGGVSHLHFANALQGGNSQKRGGGIAPNWPC